MIDELFGSVAAAREIQTVMNLSAEKAPDFKMWYCPECGHEVHAKDRPDPIRWSDFHTCRFVAGEA